MNILIKGETGDWEVVIGIEVHAQIVSNSKLFSSASTKFGGEHNTQVSFVDAGMPGMLPVINWVCFEQAIRTGLGLNAKINNYSIFDRKNYFYPDLPQGYQISQFKQPIVGEGSVLSMGVYIGASTRIVDRSTGEIHYGKVPEYSVVVPGTMPSKNNHEGPSLYCVVIVKKVDEKTRSKTSINDLLRD